MIMPTGGGKSLCYQIPALVRDGVAVVVSPLIALMSDQVAALRELGVSAAYLNSTLALDEQQRIEAELVNGTIDLVYVAPERLLQPRMLSRLANSPVSLFAIDEAHCVSQWGHDFRPEYRGLARLAETFPDVPRIALTATADLRTREEIIEQLGLARAAHYVHSFDRPNIQYRVAERGSAKQQLQDFIDREHARDAGIETVYQNLALSPALSIADNMFLGREIFKEGISGSVFKMLDKKKMQDFARAKLTELGLMTVQSITQAVETLSGGQRQGVAVARAAAFATRVVIMDEPTAALGVKESRRVLELIQDVKSRGMPIVLISHNMPHVFEVADRIHIHRLSRRHAVIRPQDFTMSDAVAIMTGAMEPPAEIALPEGAVLN